MQPGDLVVCVNNGPIVGAANIDLHLLTKGDVYTVKEIYLHGSPGGFGIDLFEVPSNRPQYCWHSERFRPCRPTDISAITAGVKEREMVE
jgi:hypothetical protein